MAESSEKIVIKIAFIQLFDCDGGGGHGEMVAGPCCLASYDASMATRDDVIEQLVKQLHGVGCIRSRKMFGEFALYLDNKVVALVCDDQLYVKPTAAGRAYLVTVEEASPYPGSKPYFWIDEGKWDDAPWLCQLFRLTADALPTPKAKHRPKG